MQSRGTPRGAAELLAVSRNSLRCRGVPHGFAERTRGSTVYFRGMAVQFTVVRWSVRSGGAYHFILIAPHGKPRGTADQISFRELNRAERRIKILSAGVFRTEAGLRRHMRMR